MKQLLFLIACVLFFKLNVSAQKLIVESDLEYQQSVVRLTTNDLLQFRVRNDLGEEHISKIAIDVSSSEGLLLSLESTQVTIKEGINLGFNLIGRNGLNQKFVSSAYMDVLRPGFSFIPGNYSICYTILSTELVPESRKCFQLEVINPFDLLLIYPFDQESIVEDKPVFTWTPTVHFGKRIQYQVKWVESEKEVLSEASFSQANPHFVVKNLRSNNYPYGIKSPKLSKKKYYFWKVYAYAGTQKITESEIWRFDLKNQKDEEKDFVWSLDTSRDYGKIPIAILSDRLSLKVSNFSQNSFSELMLLDSRGNKVWEYLDRPKGEDVHGEKQIELDLEGIVYPNKVYTLRITSGSKTKNINLYRKVL